MRGILPCMLCAAALWGQIARADGLIDAKQNTIYPRTVYIEDTLQGHALNFEVGFRARQDCRLLIVTFKYLDANDKPLLYRRLVQHQLNSIARFVGIFNEKKDLRCFDTDLKAGDKCYITHPYGQIDFGEHLPAAVEFWALLLSKDGKQVEEVKIRVPVRQYRPKTRLRLPVKGTWWHLEGHDTFAHHRQVYHHTNSNYFASDFVKMDEKMQMLKGTGQRNEDFFSYDAPIFAAADGKVVKVVDGVPDNPVGGRAEGFDPNDDQRAAGNVVVIDHGNSEYTLYAHLRKGTIPVKEGDTVKQSQEIGRCGNSGNSDSPHLHWHLMAAPNLETLESPGLPALIEEFYVLRGGEKVLMRNKSLLAGEIVWAEE